MPAGIASRLAAAETHCKRRGVQLTALRREIFELLLRRNGPAKAYDLQGDMTDRHGRVAPTTVYRALEFLVDQHLVHRVDALNAFIVCNAEHVDHRALLLVCSICHQTTELEGAQAFDAVEKSLRQAGSGFAQTTIEVKGICRKCSEAALPEK